MSIFAYDVCLVSLCVVRFRLWLGVLLRCRCLSLQRQHSYRILAAGCLRVKDKDLQASDKRRLRQTCVLEPYAQRRTTAKVQRRCRATRTSNSTQALHRQSIHPSTQRHRDREAVGVRVCWGHLVEWLQAVAVAVAATEHRAVVISIRYIGVHQ